MTEDYEGKKDPLGERMKKIESESLLVTRVDATSPFIIRLDGSKFSTLTKSLEKPFDVRFYNSMLQTTKDLVEKFKPVTGYSHSDEITLIFASATTREEIEDFVGKGKQPKNHLNNGRVVKLLTMIAGYCSVRFNFHSIEWNKKQSAFFDARLMVFTSENLFEVVNHMLWRSCRDSIRNCVSAYGRHILGVKGVFGLNSTEIIEKMLKDKQFDFTTQVPIEYRHGVYVKKELIMMSQATTGSGATAATSSTAELNDPTGTVFYRGRFKELKFKLEISLDKNHDYWLKFLLSKYSSSSGESPEKEELEG